MTRHAAPQRSGSILILAAGLSIVMVVLALTFFNRMRMEARGADVLAQDVQARIMLHAAICYIQEAARIGYATGNPATDWDERYLGYQDPKTWAWNGLTAPTTDRTVPRHDPAPGASANFKPYGAVSYTDHWSGGSPADRETIGKEYDRRFRLDDPKRYDPPDGTLPSIATAFGTYGAGSSETHTRKSWVGWYTPHHRGFYRSPWEAQDAPVLAWWKSHRQAPEQWEPRLRSTPNADSDPGNAGTKAFGGTYDDYYDGHRAEITDAWPLPHRGGKPKLFQMFAHEEPPFAVIPHLTHVDLVAFSGEHPIEDKTKFLFGFRVDNMGRNCYAFRMDKGSIVSPSYMLNQTRNYKLRAGGPWCNMSFQRWQLMGRKVQYYLSDAYNAVSGNQMGYFNFMDPDLLWHPADTDISYFVDDDGNPMSGDPDAVGGKYFAWGAGGPTFTGHAARWMGLGTVMDFERNLDGSVKRYDTDTSAQPLPNPGARPGRYVRLTPRYRRDLAGNIIETPSGNKQVVKQSDPKPASTNKSWFRIYRETHDTFIVTVGAGGSNGWRIRGGAIEGYGTDVIADEPCPFVSAGDLQLAIDQETRLWYRVCWQPTTRATRQWEFMAQWSSMGGSIKYVQRLDPADLQALETSGRDW